MINYRVRKEEKNRLPTIRNNGGSLTASMGYFKYGVDDVTSCACVLAVHTWSVGAKSHATRSAGRHLGMDLYGSGNPRGLSFTNPDAPRPRPHALSDYSTPQLSPSHPPYLHLSHIFGMN